MKYYSKYLIVGFILLLIVQVSCTPMDDYKRFITDKEIQYPGRIDSVVVFSGDERVIVNGLFISDPKVSACRIFWNNMQDSLEVPIVRTDEVDTLMQEIKLPENVYSFIIHTYDQLGNRSVPVYATGQAYGQTYKQSIVNRLVEGRALAEDNKLTISWYEIEKTMGPLSTEVTYTNAQGAIKKVYLPVDQKSLEISDYKTESSYSYRTLYIPDTLCIDTFYTAAVEKAMPMIRIPKKSWEITGFDSQEERGEQGGKYGWAKQIIDDDITTYWHSRHMEDIGPRPPFPHFISFDMKEAHVVTNFSLTPRQDGGDPFKDFEILGSMDGETWTSCGEFTLAKDKSTQKFDILQPSAMRHVKLVMKNDYANQPYTFLAEITLYK